MTCLHGQAAAELHYVQIRMLILLYEPDLGALVNAPKKFGLDLIRDIGASVDSHSATGNTVGEQHAERLADQGMGQPPGSGGLEASESYLLYIRLHRSLGIRHCTLTPSC